MGGYSKCPQLLDLIPKEEWLIVKRAEEATIHGFSEGKTLELSLGPPGGDWADTGNNNTTREREHESLLSLGYFSKNSCVQHHPRLKMKSPWQKHQTVMKESSQPCSNRLVELQSAEKKAFSSAAAAAVPANYIATSAQKRTAPSPVVGWPPIRSFRKNITSGSSLKLSSKSPGDGPTEVSGGPKASENGPRSLFVKINMDGIPIGRKVDLKTHDSYDKLSYVVDELLQGLLAVQIDCGGMKDKGDERKGTGCLSDGSGEYTLVYEEDNEGDRMLVGDVPWHMFVSTVKRLRVLKSSELTALSRDFGSTIILQAEANRDALA
ncbi:hypothetical protein OROGR_028921 [Orobanche gracilis]